MQRPAEQLATRIAKVIKEANHGAKLTIVSVASLKQWHALAKRIDARMRLDGSPKSKQRKRKASPPNTQRRIENG